METGKWKRIEGDEKSVEESKRGKQKQKGLKKENEENKNKTKERKCENQKRIEGNGTNWKLLKKKKGNGNERKWKVTNIAFYPLPPEYAPDSLCVYQLLVYCCNL